MKILKYSSKKNLLIFFTFLISYYWLRKVLLIFIDLTQSADFPEYIVYFEHFKDGTIKTGREQGLMYYYIQYIYFQYKYFNNLNSNIFLGKSIFEVNDFLFIIGLIGLFKILNFYNYSFKAIFLTFIFINFFPVAIAMRIYFKPEILAFSLLPWIIFCLECIKLKINKNKYLLALVPLLVSILSLKGSITTMVAIFLIIYYLKIILKTKVKELLVISIFFIILFITLNYENFTANGNNLLQVQSGATLRENYDNKAPLNVFYHFDLKTTLTLPIKHYHANSFASITLLDTFGDYFDLNWDNDSSQLFKNRNNLLNLNVSNEIKPPRFDKNSNLLIVYVQNLPGFYPREVLGLLFSLIFYFLILKSFFKPQISNKFIFIFLIGYFVLFIHTFLGFPVNNFDPSKADTFKTHYYSFLLIISAVFLIAPKITNKKNIYLYLIVYCLGIIYILGFPKYNNYDIQVSISRILESSVNCTFDKFFFEQLMRVSGIECNIIDSIKAEKNTELSLFFIKPVNLILIILNLLSIIFVGFNRYFIKTK